MSLYTVAEICQKLLYQFSMSEQSELLSYKAIETHIKLAEKFDIDLQSLHESVFPLQTLSTLFLELNTPFLKKPKTIDEEIIYGIFIKLIAFYILANQLSNALRTDNTDYFLNGVKGELEYLIMDIENDHFPHIAYSALKKELVTQVTDCLKRLNTIIQLPMIVVSKEIIYFSELPIYDISILDIFNVLGQVQNAMNENFVQKMGFTSIYDWYDLINGLSVEGIDIFYKELLPFLDANETLQLIIDKNAALNDKLTETKQNNPMIYHILKITTYCQYVLSYIELVNDDSRILMLQQLSDEALKYRFEELAEDSDIDADTLELLIHKIAESISYMLSHGIALRPKSILEMELDKITLNNILDTLFELSSELITVASDQESVQLHYNELFDFMSRHPVNLTEYAIPFRASNALQTLLQENYCEIFPERKDHFFIFYKQHPLLLDIIALHYFILSLSIYPDLIMQSRAVVFVYENVIAMIKNKNHHVNYVARSDYFKQALIKIMDYFIFLCDESTANAFIIRALQLDFSIVATFAQGTREYFEQEDGLCKGYVYQLAEYLLIDQSDNPNISKRSHRWNMQSQPSPFAITQKSPYRLVMANKRTYDFQSKPLIEVTDALQMVNGTSPFQFHSGAEIAEQLLIMLKEHPNAILSLGMYEKGATIGHAVACFKRDNLLHFFCATHSWVTIPYDNAKALPAFLHWIYSELPFFQQYTHFHIDIIYRTWEAPPVDDKYFHYEHDENLMPLAFENDITQKMLQNANSFIQTALSNQYEMLQRHLGII